MISPYRDVRMDGKSEKLPKANEAVKRWGNNRFVRMVSSKESKRFLQLVSLRSQLICRVVRQSMEENPVTRRTALALLSSLLVACGSEDAGVTATGVRTEIDTVSGIERIRNFGVPPTWRLEKLLTIGSVGTLGEPAPDEFALVTSAIWGPGDRVYVADGTNAEVKVFDLNGSLALRFGRHGEGPGEFGSLYSLAWMGDTLLGLDLGVGRLALFDMQGQWLGQRRLSGSVSGSPADLRLYQTGDSEAYAFSLHATPNGIRSMLVRHTSTSSDDTLWLLPADDEDTPSYVICRHPSGAIGFMDIPFAAKLLQHPAQGKLLAVVRTDVYRIAYLNSDGDTIRIVERALQPVPTSAEEWNDGLKEYREFRERYGGASCQPSMPQRPDLQPPVRDMHLDPAGRLWVEAVTVDGPYWEVFAPPGILIGRIPVFPRSDRTVPYFAQRHVVAVSTDSLGVQLISVYEFLR